ncbi:hypothetical protein EXE46_14350 [Halorubrum sp. GN11_10-6_MGM]|uniref:DUF7315 family membrane protein n=1 Tax=Halorubrum sp. GN11_10-6_MGM TaxID=2518112 RepID=UPI0010FA02BB|nr:hypothetical protein [Halorubrum sp. GN11_10-6_MGM]TKX73416.1 hypothetical protein EXE46_14350 [Halorubrum sp. GN11_10-6_MGM]
MSSSTDGDASQAFDETGDPIAADDDADPRNEPTGPREGASGREVVVPFRLYKAVTVFSTLAAVVTYFVGFTLIDAATLQISFVRTTIVYLLDSAGILPPEDVLVAILAITGVGFILLGTAVYVLGTRFRGQGMGKSQDDSSET